MTTGSSPSPVPVPQHLQALAAEFALGLLSATEAEQASERAAIDADFSAEVERWRRHFSGFDRTTPMATLPPDLWSRIEAKLADSSIADDAPSLETSRSRELRDAGRLPVSSGEAAADSRRRMAGWVWNSLGFWRIGGLVATAAAIIITMGLGSQLQQARSAPVLVAILQTPDNQTAAVINAFADGRTELVPLTTFTVPAGKVLEVWTLWDRQVGPRSVGLLQAMASSRLKLDNLPLGANQLFEITLEPAGGSPIGRPTGPILAIGRTAQRI